MERGKHQALRRHAFFMHAHRDTPAVIRDGAGAVRFQHYLYPGTVACQMLVHGIVHDLIDQMVQPLSAGASYIHSRTHPDRFQPFQHRYAAGVIRLLACHTFNLFHYYILYPPELLLSYLVSGSGGVSP